MLKIIRSNETAKLQWLQDTSKINGDNLKIVKLETSRYFRNKERKYLMDLVEAGWGDVDWIGVAKDRNRWRAVVNLALNLRVP
jgi:hypothetical protein